MVKAPTTNDPTTEAGYPLALDRRNYVIQNMVEIKAITQQEADAAKATKLVVKDKRTPNGCVAANVNAWGFFCDYFYRWWMDQETFGSTRYDRERRLKSGGYNVVTTIDVQAQTRRGQGGPQGQEREQQGSGNGRGGRAGHRPGTGARCQPAVQARRPEEPEEQALQRSREEQEEDPGQLPGDRQPAAHRR